jgi:hypothetical protein
MNVALLRSIVIGVSAVICSLIVAGGLEGLARSSGTSSGSDVGRYVLHRETNEGWLLLDTKSGRVCFTAMNAPNGRCTLGQTGY